MVVVAITRHELRLRDNLSSFLCRYDVRLCGKPNSDLVIAERLIHKLAVAFCDHKSVVLERRVEEVRGLKFGSPRWCRFWIKYDLMRLRSALASLHCTPILLSLVGMKQTRLVVYGGRSAVRDYGGGGLI